MPSPFPGMDPYLEAHWGDIHHSLITYARDEIRQHLPPGLRARVEERVFVQSPEGIARPIFPDIRVTERREPRERTQQASRVRGGVVVAESVMVPEPLVLYISDELMSEGYIEIVDVRSGERVVTILEVLSPSNKHPGEGQEKYLQKQREAREAGVSLVEIDLLRAGRRVASVPREQVPPAHRTPYQVCIRKGWRPGAIEIYRVPLRERLPLIPVPLRETDDEILLDLQPLLARAYDNGDYEDLDYTQEPDPHLSPRDAQWADRLLRQAGLRGAEGAEEKSA